MMLMAKLFVRNLKLSDFWLETSHFCSGLNETDLTGNKFTIFYSREICYSYCTKLLLEYFKR